MNVFPSSSGGVTVRVSIPTMQRLWGGFKWRTMGDNDEVAPQPFAAIRQLNLSGSNGKLNKLLFAGSDGERSVGIQRWLFELEYQQGNGFHSWSRLVWVQVVQRQRFKQLNMFRSLKVNSVELNCALNLFCCFLSGDQVLKHTANYVVHRTTSLPLSYNSSYT